MSYMKMFSEFSVEDQMQFLIIAKHWYAAHKEHVDQLVSHTRDYFPPSGSDCYKPELWKSGSWKWFIEEKLPDL